MYCNLLQCSHFADTAIVAEHNGDLCGFVSGYRLPTHSDTLFIWQVAVAPEARGLGLASQMLQRLLQRHPDVRWLHTSITASNQASWNTFRKLARQLYVPLQTRVMFDRAEHFAGEHDTETLVCIGPLRDSAGTSHSQAQEI